MDRASSGIASRAARYRCAPQRMQALAHHEALRIQRRAACAAHRRRRMDKTRDPTVSTLRACAAAAAIGATLTLSACVAVPVDTRTGQLIWPPASNPTAPREAAAMATPMPPAAPTVYTARLYPINDVANRAGMLTAVVTDGQGGRGSLTLNYLGEAMQGEATRVDNGHVGFGRIH